MRQRQRRLLYRIDCDQSFVKLFTLNKMFKSQELPTSNFFLPRLLVQTTDTACYTQVFMGNCLFCGCGGRWVSNQRLLHLLSTNFNFCVFDLFNQRWAVNIQKPKIFLLVFVRTKTVIFGLVSGWKSCIHQWECGGKQINGYIIDSHKTTAPQQWQGNAMRRLPCSAISEQARPAHASRRSCDLWAERCGNLVLVFCTSARVWSCVVLCCAFPVKVVVLTVPLIIIISYVSFMDTLHLLSIE